jgi:elongation factor P--(R)-beta-lysine ligase
MSGAGDRPRGWCPAARLEVLEQRAMLLARARAFFQSRGLLEVETPLIVNAPVTDLHIHSARVQLDRSHGYFLQTSPEYAMKRLLAAGSGDIFQICKAVRGFERSRLHNPEFTLIEWYRTGFSIESLMSEVEGLVRELLGAAQQPRPAERIHYRDAFLRELGLDPLTAGLEDIARLTRPLGYTSQEPCESQGSGSVSGAAERDTQLELLMGALVGPKLGRGALTFVHRYPASQAALAELDPDDSRVALRFELYCEGVELANGFQELGSAAEQRARFERDREERGRRALPVFDMDERLLAALAAGLPPCAGVALGFDRLAMLATGASHIDEVLAFPIESA